MTVTVAIAGATGYAGGEIARLLVGHPCLHSGDLEIRDLTASRSAGTPTDQALPHLPTLWGRSITETDVKSLSQHDVVFLALPHGHSDQVARELPGDVVVIDCAADHRLRDKEAWQHWYGGEFAQPWTYGIPEMPHHREEIRTAKRIALPGCFPTGATLAALPAVARGLIHPNLAITAISGVSGAGKKPVAANLAAEVMGSLKAYNTAGRHRHTPEIVQNLTEVAPENQHVSVCFNPILAPLPRGILTVVTAPLADAALTTASAREAYGEFYVGEEFVRLLPEGVQPQTQWVVGANTCLMQVEVDPLARRLVVTLAIDNLTKGTAGAAVQCMNLAVGFEETSGLPTAAVAP